MTDTLIKRLRSLASVDFDNVLIPAADALEQQAAEIAQWKAEYEAACVLVGKMHEAAVGEVIGPRLGVVEDVQVMRTYAERYQWLREQHWSSSPIACVENPKEAIKLGYNCPSQYFLDDAIDTAMRQEKQTKEKE